MQGAFITTVALRGRSKQHAQRKKKRARQAGTIKIISLMLAATALLALVSARYGFHDAQSRLVINFPAEASRLIKPAAAALAPRTGGTGQTASAAEETPETEETASGDEGRYAGLAISDEDIELLARLVWHEARGESFEGQVAVIEVVLNRMLSAYFPNTVEEVIFQRCGEIWQFSPAPYLHTADPGEEQYIAVYTALEGESHVLAADTVFFSTVPYNTSLDKIIGNHYFCKIF